MRKFSFFVIWILSVNSVLCQGFKEVTFESSDGLPITADFYETSKEAPNLILFHQSVSSRGEYRSIAPRLQQMGFNCLVVDLRWGKQDFWNSIPNETAKRNGTYEVVENYKRSDEYQLNKVWPIIWQSYEDMKASISYLKNEGYNKKIVVVGSSFSAMMVFKLSFDGLPVSGIVAFSPGEYHPTNDSLLSIWTEKVTVPTYLSAGKDELEMVNDVRRHLPGMTSVALHQSAGRHGASVLISEMTDWKPLQKFLTQFLRKNHTVGFERLSLSRESELWKDGDKPIETWFWYPTKSSHVKDRMSYANYIKLLNSRKNFVKNLETYSSILLSFSRDSVASHLLKSQLERDTYCEESARRMERKPALVVLSGGHPIYFTVLAERLAQEGFVVLFVPRVGFNYGERLPFTEDGVVEYTSDLNHAIDFVGKEGFVDISQLSFVSWSFEGVPTFNIALERSADLFISLDSSIGYEYGEELMSEENWNSKWMFDLVHYTGSNMDFGKSLSLFEKNSENNLELIRAFDFEHGAFTSLASISIPRIKNDESISDYELLILDIINRIKRLAQREEVQKKH